MKIYILLISFILISCSAKQDKNSLEAQECEQNQTVNINEEINTDTTVKEIITKNIETEEPKTWEEHQDSLRNLLLASKSNVILKSNFFQEFYIRGFVNQVKDKIEFDLSFDLHSFDCGAPDCYSTNLSFKIPVKNQVEFPKQINCQFVEKGCGIEQEIPTGINFELVESSPKYINYYSKTQKANLILIGDKQNSNLYYFDGVEPNLIKVDLINKILSEYDEENPNAIVPYRSTKMLTNEYENFIEKK